MNASTYELQQKLFKLNFSLAELSMSSRIGCAIYRARDQKNKFANKKVFQDHSDHPDVMRWSTAICRQKNVLKGTSATLKDTFSGSNDSHLHVLIRESHLQRSPSDIVLTYRLGIYQRSVLFHFRFANYYGRFEDGEAHVSVNRDATVAHLLQAVSTVKPDCDPTRLEIFKFSEAEPLKDLSGYLTPMSDISDEEGEEGSGGEEAGGEGAGGEGAGGEVAGAAEGEGTGAAEGEGAGVAEGGTMDVDADRWARPWENSPLYLGDTILMAFPNVDHDEQYFVVRDSAYAIVRFVQRLSDTSTFSSFARGSCRKQPRSFHRSSSTYGRRRTCSTPVYECASVHGAFLSRNSKCLEASANSKRGHPLRPSV